MKTSNVQLALVVLVAAAAVVTALGQTTTDNKGDQGADKEQSVYGSRDLREPHGSHGLRGNDEIPRTSSLEIKPPTVLSHREKRGYNPGSNPGGCPPCPPCIVPGIGSVRS